MTNGTNESRPHHQARLSKKKVFLISLGIVAAVFMIFMYSSSSYIDINIARGALSESFFRSFTASMVTGKPTQSSRILVSNSTSTFSPVKQEPNHQDTVSNESSENIVQSSQSPSTTTSTPTTLLANGGDGKYNLITANETESNSRENHKDKVVIPSASPVATIASQANTSGTCNATTRIVYIKSHKTGSTTLASIFERFGYHRDLIFAVPRGSHIFSNDKLFSRSMILPWPREFAASHPYYDMLVNHAVYNRPEMNKVVPNATFVTILRDPVHQLESAFGYFEMAKGMGLAKEKKPFTTFMNDPMYYYTTKKYGMRSRSRNGQLYDLGFNPKLVNDTKAIREKIDTIDKEFDLVMITDYFDESLLLLKKLLCWSFDDILYISNGIRSDSHRYSISDELKNNIHRWNAGDVSLYNHFNETLWRKVKEYGPDFDTDLEIFRKLNVELFNKCVDQNKLDTSDKRSFKYKLNANSGVFCQDLLRGDVGYTPKIRKKMKDISTPKTIPKPYPDDKPKLSPKTDTTLSKTAPKLSPKTDTTLSKSAPKLSPNTEPTLSKSAPKLSPNTEPTLSNSKSAPKLFPKTDTTSSKAAPKLSPKTDTTSSNIAPKLSPKTEPKSSKTAPNSSNTKTQVSSARTVPKLPSKTVPELSFKTKSKTPPKVVQKSPPKS